MIDINLIRQNPNIVRKSLKKRGIKDDAIDEIEVQDELWRKYTQKLELLQSESNRLSKDKNLAAENKSQLIGLKKEITSIKTKATTAQAASKRKLLIIPNIVLDDVPSGGEESNRVIDKTGNIVSKKTPAHEESLTKEGSLILDVAAKYSGTRYRYLSGKAAVAQRKLFNLAIEFAEKNGFTPVMPPVVVKGELMEAAGFFPSGKDDTFSLGNNQYLVGTSEPALLALAADKKHKQADLPIRMVGFSTCFRKEVGSYGKDVKGMFRVHQFDKVEMVSIVLPEKSTEEHEFLINLQKEFVDKFSIPYRTVMMAAGDQSQIAAKQIDLECHFPSQQRYRETHSASNCTDYQSRLLKIKVDNGGQTELAHTLNATLATERLLLAIVENNTDQNLEINWPKELIS